MIQKKQLNVKDVLKYLYESKDKKRLPVVQPLHDKNKEHLQTQRKII